jgi:hypothetical protein
MQSKFCKSCNQNFHVTNEDENFYKKISPTFAGKFYQIPSPTLCPQCRTIRRLAYRNENKLYRRKSDLTGKEMISVFRPDSQYKIYTQDEWWSDKWDPMDYGQDPDLNHAAGRQPKPFFDQFHELLLKVPRPPLINNKAENSEYCNFADENKNSYMISSANRNQDCYYGFLLVENRDCTDCLWCTKCELLYECVDCQNCYNLSHAQNCENCVDSSFLFNCKSVRNCLFCVNLKNAKYHIANKQVTKEEYEKVLATIRDPYAAISKFEQIKLEFPVRKANNFVSCENVTGENIFHSKNIRQGFDVYKSRDSAYLHDGLTATDCYDVCFFDGTELCYESTSLIGYGYRFTNFCRDSYNLFYCDNCHGCKNLFACAGLKQKEYCIFNKQYEKDEYERTCAAIIEHMMKAGEWGEFFPAEKSPFPFEDTLSKIIRQ